MPSPRTHPPVERLIDLAEQCMPDILTIVNHTIDTLPTADREMLSAAVAARAADAADSYLPSTTVDDGALRIALILAIADLLPILGGREALAQVIADSNTLEGSPSPTNTKIVAGLLFGLSGRAAIDSRLGQRSMQLRAKTLNRAAGLINARKHDVTSATDPHS